MTKLFVTGATGYIGGDALYAVAATYPDLEITALVRNSDKGAKVASQYSKVRLVYGDLSSTELLTTEAANADIVLHCADARNEGPLKAILAGLAQRTTPSYLIHTSGAGILAWADLESKTYGVERKKIYNDWDGISEITSIPDTALLRPVEKLVFAASQNNDKIFTAIVCAPCIYGPGRGPDNQRSVQVYNYAATTLKRGKGWIIEGGTNVWNGVHIQDLSNIFLALVTSAMQPEGGKATWNSEGYYFAEDGDFAWGDIGRSIAKIAHQKKYIDTTELDSVTGAEADNLTIVGGFLLGTNSRSKAIRAEKLLGWKPVQKKMADMLPEIVDAEARSLGITQGHAVKAAGDA